jgi:hypothetical protein
MGSCNEALRAGYTPKKTPTAAEKENDMITDQTETLVGSASTNTGIRSARPTRTIAHNKTRFSSVFPTRCNWELDSGDDQLEGWIASCYRSGPLSKGTHCERPQQDDVSGKRGTKKPAGFPAGLIMELDVYYPALPRIPMVQFRDRALCNTSNKDDRYLFTQNLNVPRSLIGLLPPVALKRPANHVA